MDANGGAQSCALEPFSPEFQRQLREQLYATNFEGVSGAVAVTQCAGADFDSDGLVTSDTYCGDRTGMKQELLVYSRSEDVNQWKHVAVVNTDTAQLQMSTGGQFVFLGNNLTIPVDYVPAPICGAGTWKTENFTCAACEPGKYSDGNVADLPFCLQCPAGISSVCTAAGSIGVF